MIYLQKTNSIAIKFVSDFLDSNWIEQNNGNYKYQNIGYSEIKNPAKEFKEFFIDEQNSQCCYCCRIIKNNHTSTELEHIIPRSKVKIEEFEKYYFFSNILRDNVIPQNTFETSVTKLTTPPFPHHIAYQNIVASCNGRTFETGENFTCCNRERGDEFVLPFNLMSDSVEYLPDGTIVYSTDITSREYFEILNLDKTILNKIRRLWFLFSKSQLDLEEILNDNLTKTLTEKIVRYAIANSTTPVGDIILTETFSNQNTWNIFKDYSFFLQYYRNNN